MRVLITGMSATGKSTVVEALRAQGYRAVDTDDGWCTTSADGEWVWNEPLIEQLLDEGDDDILFVAGTASNQGKFRDRFAHIVLLSAPIDVIVERLATRTNNPFGKSDAQRAQVRADTSEVEPRLRRVADLELDTRRPLSDVVQAIVAIAHDSVAAADESRIDFPPT